MAQATYQRTPAQQQKLDDALAKIAAAFPDPKARIDRICDKLIASGRLVLVDLDAGTVEHVAPVQLGRAA
jgi:hypothetical protein